MQPSAAQACPIRSQAGACRLRHCPIWRKQHPPGRADNKPRQTKPGASGAPAEPSSRQVLCEGGCARIAGSPAGSPMNIIKAAITAAELSTCPPLQLLIDRDGGQTVLRVSSVLSRHRRDRYVVAPATRMPPRCLQRLANRLFIGGSAAADMATPSCAPPVSPPASPFCCWGATIYTSLRARSCTTTRAGRPPARVRHLGSATSRSLLPTGQSAGA